MTVEISQEQRQALKGGASPLYVVDSRTCSTYVLVPSEMFERLQSLSQPDVTDMYPLQEQAAMDVWSDPGMDIYDDYDAYRAKK